jgi:hypothetical protein
MRKRMVNQAPQDSSFPDQSWLDLERIAQVEVTSEEAAYPIESALIPGAGIGWRAAQPGKQVLRLVFDDPLSLRRIYLLFLEDDMERTQEFVLRWLPDGGRSYREILRQQYNFSPPRTTKEVEDYAANLDGVTALELWIDPDVGGGEALASLSRLRLA